MVACPAPEQLRGFASGLLTDDLSATIGAHLESCTLCQGTLAGLGQRELPSTHLGRYRLQRVLGAGGMGVVYRAWDPQLARGVAIKVVKHAGPDEASRARLVREAQSLARLSHPNVCHVYDVGTHAEEVWVAMELIEGSSLRAWAAKQGHAEILRALLAAAEGIHAAHLAGMVHRDVKPENVLVATTGRAVVTDFGLARGGGDGAIDGLASTAMSGSDPRATVESAMTASGVVAGTPAYLAPEQLTGAPLDARVDQFAWAVMAWELLTGMLPFPIVHGARLEAIRAGLTAPASMSRPLAAALQRALAIAPRDRFPSMRELIDAVAASAPQRSSARPRALAIGGVLALAGAGVAIWRVQARDDAPVTAPATSPADATFAVTTPADATLIATADLVDAALATTLPAPSVSTDAADAGALRPDAARVTSDRAPSGSLPPTPDAAVALTVDRTDAAVPSLPPPATTTNDDDTWALDARTTRKNRGIAENMIDTYCLLSTSPAKATGDRQIADWGPLVRREIVVTTTSDGDERQLALYEVKGQRAAYRFKALMPYLYLPVTAGELVVVCPEGLKSQERNVPAAWAGLVAVYAYLPVSRAPRIIDYAKLDPIHRTDTSIGRDAQMGTPPFAAGKHHLVRAKPESFANGRWTMQADWDVEVAPSATGANLVSENKTAWYLFDRGAFVDVGGKQRFVAHAIAVFNDMFPP